MGGEKVPQMRVQLSLIAASMILTLLMPSDQYASAAPGSCKKIGAKRTQGGDNFICTRIGKKLIWKLIAPNKKSEPTTSTAPSTIASPAASPTPINKSTPVTTPSASTTKCSEGSLFKRLPVDFSKISSVSPIGVFAPVGGSPLPKQHTGFMLNELGVPLIAPGDLTITEIRKVTYSVSPTRPGYVDYAIFFSVCDEVKGHFGHVTDLNLNLQPEASAFQCSKYSTVDETVESCTAYTKIKVAEGTQIATSGNAAHSPAVDMGMTDLRISDGYINPGRYGKSQAPGTLCPWDFYTETPKSQLYSKIGLSATNLTTETPKCGTLAIDKVGTAAGRWTPKGDPGNGMDPADGRFLVFALDTYKPQSRIAFSTRIKEIVPSAQYEVVNYPRFPLQESGRLNLNPNRLKQDGQIYCYVVDSSASTETFLIQLISENEMKIEKFAHTSGQSPCNVSPSQWTFTSKAVSLVR